MSKHRQLVIGMFGFGVVGEGLYKVLKQTPSLSASIKKYVSRIRGKSEMPRKNFLLLIKMISWKIRISMLS
ncbi:hypothetical protein [Niabella hibiscisoli]|uniref:hypothetical protein n=1 Tax=Niabella hibiscisoli TaxID=1825928 RepID=UPI001F111C8E|nr:hypothetical protein [Niabella hibiscisoli]MCH5720688.1 hypothetical protein [Niabella hibiscisoli]